MYRERGCVRVRVCVCVCIQTYHTWFGVDVTTKWHLHLAQKGRKLEGYKYNLALGANVKPWGALCFKDMQGSTGR